jgi:hypothetical protein
MESHQTLLESTLGTTSRKSSLDCPEQEESHQVFSAKEILVRTSPSEWVITKTVNTIQIQTRDIKLIRSAIAELSVLRPQDDRLEKEFNERAGRWEKQTGIHSSPVIRFMHDDYQSIMAKGKEVIPYILNRMKTKPDDWFWALRHITNHDAAVVSGATNFDEAVAAWLKWGVINDYILE